MKLCIPTLSNYDGVDELVRSAEAGRVKPTGYVVLDNGGGYSCERLVQVVGRADAEAAFIQPRENLGVAASWNRFLDLHQHEPIVISNDDIVLGEEAFADLVRHSYERLHAGYGWALFMQRPDCTEKVGYYDENFWPAYYEDIDYIIRMRRAGVPEHRLEGKIDIQHGGWTTVNQLGDPPWLADGRDKNRSYLIAKWGTDQHGTPYAEPFNGRPPPGWDLRTRLPALPLRWDLVNAIARRICANRYLELGLADGACIRRIKVADRTGVDIVAPPNAGEAVVYQCTTDEFFRTTDQRFDLVFVDADHAWEQAYRDVENAIRHLNPGGVVVMHDCSPFSEPMQIVPHNGYYLWTGDVWKAIVKLRWEGRHATRVVDSNYGLGIVIPGGTIDHLARRPRKPEALSYQDLVENRADLLGLLSGWEWEEWFDRAYEPVGENFVAKYLRGATEEELRRLDGLAELDKKYGNKPAPALAEMREAAEFISNGLGLRPPPCIKAFEREVQSISVAGQTFGGGSARDELAVIFSKLPRADTTGTHLLKAFEELGVKVRHYEPCRRALLGAIVEQDIEIPELSSARAILCIDDDHGWQVPAAPGIPKYYWCIDTYRMDAELYLGGTRRARIKEFDKVFYVQQAEAREFGGEWLPVGVDIAQYRYEPRTENVYDFCFIGNPNTARTAFLERLQRDFPKSFVGTAYGEEANRIYNQSALAVNMSAGSDINMRMFEAQATSALCLSNRIDNGEAELLPYLLLYESYEECVALMRTFLRQPGVRELIAKTQAATMGEHTYQARARQFLASIGWEL